MRSWPARMGVRPGSNIVLVADLIRIAWAFRKAGQRFSPDDLLNAFLGQIGTSGTIAVPTFNYDLQPGESFDRKRTPTISGALGQAALTHPSFQRTAQPLHSFAVAGALQQEFLNIDGTSSFGNGSAFEHFHRHDLQLIAIDMPLEPAFTYVHFVEEQMQVGYRETREIPIVYTDLDGNTTTKKFLLYAKRPGYVNDFKALEPLLTDAGVLVKDEADGFPYLRMSLRNAHAVIENDILHNRGKSIVQFNLKWWLRDLLKPIIKGSRPSRSALSIK